MCPASPVVLTFLFYLHVDSLLYTLANRQIISIPQAPVPSSFISTFAPHTDMYLCVCRGLWGARVVIPFRCQNPRCFEFCFAFLTFRFRVNFPQISLLSRCREEQCGTPEKIVANFILFRDLTSLRAPTFVTPAQVRARLRSLSGCGKLYICCT